MVSPLKSLEISGIFYYFSKIPDFIFVVIIMSFCLIVLNYHVTSKDKNIGPKS